MKNLYKPLHICKLSCLLPSPLLLLNRESKLCNPLRSLICSDGSGMLLDSFSVRYLPTGGIIGINTLKSIVLLVEVVILATLLDEAVVDIDKFVLLAKPA